MKKLSTILFVFLFVPMLAFGQLQIRTHKEKISDFMQKSTKVVLTGSDSLDVPIREALKDFWTISAYEFCSEEEFASLRKNDNYYFLAVGNGGDGMRYWYLVKGGSYDKKKGLSSMLTVATIPICPADGYTGREDCLLPVLACSLQNLAAKAIGSNYAGIGGKVSSLKETNGLPLYICEDELSPEIGWTERTKCQNDNITIYSTSEIDRCFYYGDQAAICFVVGPKKPVKGQSFQVYLVDSVTYSVYYNKKHKIGSSGCGLLKEDIKAFSKGR